LLNLLIIKQTYIKDYLELVNNKYSLINSNLQKLTSNIQHKNYLLDFNNFKYLLKVQLKNSKFYLQLTRNQQLEL
jgi:hypothetical protein